MIFWYWSKNYLRTIKNNFFILSPKLKFYVPQGLENVKALLGIEVEIVVNIDKNIEANPVTFYPQTKAENKITYKRNF